MSEFSEPQDTSGKSSATEPDTTKSARLPSAGQSLPLTPSTSRGAASSLTGKSQVAASKAAAATGSIRAAAAGPVPSAKGAGKKPKPARKSAAALHKSERRAPPPSSKVAARVEQAWAGVAAGPEAVDQAVGALASVHQQIRHRHAVAMQKQVLIFFDALHVAHNLLDSGPPMESAEASGSAFPLVIAMKKAAEISFEMNSAVVHALSGLLEVGTVRSDRRSRDRD